MRSALTAERARALLACDPTTGELTWRRARRVGKPAGAVAKDGYRHVQVDGVTYMEHRVVWLHLYGAWPTDQLDHIDGNRANNCPANLREATGAENQQNRAMPRSNSSGYPGVTWHRQARRWQAQIAVAGQARYLGLHATAEAAHAAYLDAKAELHPFQPAPRAHQPRRVLP